MKKICLLFVSFVLVATSFAQTDSVQAPPFKRFPSVPPMKLLLTDSTTWFTKEDISSKKPLLLMLFSPDCDHCQHETEAIISRIADFKNIQIVMATTLPFDKMMEFYNRYQLNRFPNITVGRDGSYFLPVFFNIRNLPLLAFYDKKGKLIDAAEGSLPIEKVLEKFQ